MVAYAPPLLFVLAWIFALLGWEGPGADSSTSLDENALRWILLMGVGWASIGGSIAHTFFAKSTAKAIGWVSNGFQMEVGFASLGIGLAGVVAANSSDSSAWVVASLAGGIFLFLCGINHIRDMVREKNYAPGNTVIMLSDFGIPVSLLVLLISTGAI